MEYTTDAWASDRSVIDTFSEYKTGEALPDPYRAPAYYFQDQRYGSLEDFNQAKADASATGIGYGNIGGSGEVMPPPLMFTPDPQMAAGPMYFGLPTDEVVGRGQPGNAAVEGGGLNPLILVALVFLL